MSMKMFCDVCGAEIEGNSAKVVVVSAENTSRGTDISQITMPWTLVMHATRGFVKP